MTQTRPGRRRNKEVIGGAIILRDGTIEENERRGGVQLATPQRLLLGRVPSELAETSGDRAAICRATDRGGQVAE